MRLHLEAFAKLNLALRVLHRRADGFHEIDSLVQTIDLCDRITVDASDAGIEVRNSVEIEGVDLAERAARDLLAAKGIDRGFRIRIRKGIPIGAGLGGGSSDAAAVLLAIDRMTPPLLGQDTLRTVAADIGSDVVLFLHGGLVRMRGRGEHVEALQSPPHEEYVLIVPPVHCATGPIYGAWKASRTGAAGHVLRGENDLLDAALRLHPELAPYRDAIERLDAAYWGMSGSGSSFFASFGSREAASVAGERLSQSMPEASVHVCRAVDKGHRIIEETL